MSAYAEDYFSLIHEGLNKTVVTNRNGMRMSFDEGISLWAQKALEVKEKTKGLIFFCGNGASASMAEHMSHDWFQNAQLNTTTCSEVSHITAISNDLSYDDVFSYRVKRILSDKDIFVGISSSGNSPNIVNAISAAKDNGAFTITISGKKDDNKIRRMGDINFYVPLETYGEVESAHAVLLHVALDYFLDEFMKGRH
jgi:D-sedoheptulose 7-phosphate isomerase